MGKFVAVVALGSAGDVHPNVGLALALRNRGNRVVLITSKYFEPLARRVGLEFVGLGTEEDYHAAVQDPDIWNPYRAFSVVARRLIVPSIAGVFEILSQWSGTDDAVVAASGLAFGARIAQEKLGLPLASVHLQPVMFRSVQRPAVFGFPDVAGFLPRFLRGAYLHAADRFYIDPQLAPAVNAFRAGLGLPPVSRLLDGWMHSPQLVIGLFPEWFAVPQPDWPPNVYLTGFPLYDERDSREAQPELNRFLDAGDAPLVFTGGSAMAQDAEFFRVSAEVCRASGRRGLLLTQFPEQLPAQLPEAVRHFHYVPFSEVLPRAAAFVHHGGIGTIAQGLAGGVPQLVVPLAHDQPDNAVRVRGLGVGEMLLPKHYQVKTVLRRLEEMLGSAAIRENCRRRSMDLSANSALAGTCELIEGLGG
jgi:rhamnosyltransferase subunit B